VRKVAAAVVFMSMGMWNVGWCIAMGSEPRPCEEVRIFSSLEDATRRSPRPVILVFFSLDCPACWQELFGVRYMVEKNSVPIDFVGVSADTRDELELFLEKHAFFTPVVLDRGRGLFRRFRVKLEPAVVILEGGRVLYQDNTAEDMDSRRDKVRRCLLEIAARRPS
jgi:peroxiredoxin